MTQDSKRWTPEHREQQRQRLEHDNPTQLGVQARRHTRRFTHEALAQALANLLRPADDSLEPEST